MEFRNPIFVDEKQIRIDCEINHPQYGWIPFTCDPNDTGALFDVKELHKTMLKSNPKEFVPYVPTAEEQAAQVRAQRDILLNQSDWTQLPDVPQELKTSWAEYRQQLRDVPQQVGFPFDVKWPIKP